MIIKAKLLEWEEYPANKLEGRSWNDNKLGFYISEELSEPEESRYYACWGEGDGENFATLEAAKEWCQSEIDSFIREYALTGD